jgi:hypothetical protein
MNATAVDTPRVAVTWSRDRRTVTILCPFCGARHIHGAPEGKLGHRNAHCHDLGPGLYYELVEGA